MNISSTKVLISLAFCLVLTQLSNCSFQDSPLVDGFRPPAVPLIVYDPYINIWSMSDNLYDDFTKLWCGTVKAFVGAIRIDGTPYRFMGPQNGGIPTANVITQQSVVVQPTQTLYTFESPEVVLTVRFTTATIPTDLDLLSQPVTYITFDVISNDGQAHQIEIYYDNTAEIAVNDVSEQVEWSRISSSGNSPKYIMRMGTSAQNVLGNSGDGVGINWGYAYVAVDPVDETDNISTVFAGSAEARASFVANGTIPTQDDTRQPRACSDDWPVIAITWSFEVSAAKNQSRHLTFAYDDIKSINYFGTELPAFWSRNGVSAVDMLTNATNNYTQRLSICDQFDQDLLNDLASAASAEYATIASLAYRQTFGATKLVWNQQLNTPWYFMKEISSDGDLQTVDVIFPASPLFLYMNPYLMELLLIPDLAYANNETNIPYDLAWAPHHLGTYPIGNLSPDKQEQMPVEETGNLIMMIAALVKYGQLNGQNYTSLIFPHYQNLVKSWADYLISGDGVLPDPGDQLCTDDFLGPSPHNTNLALKGIAALGCYAYVCEILGLQDDANKYMNYAQIYANYWLQNANDGDHYRLQYDLANSWSLKYNLLYQYVVGVQTFPLQVIQQEIGFYLGENLNTYGVPLNNQVTFTKLDWLSWMAAMAPNTDDKMTLFTKIYDFANESPSRVPLTDWYDTKAGTQNGFQARPVVGGFYAWMILQQTGALIEA